MRNYSVKVPSSVLEEIEHYVNTIAQDSLPHASRWYKDIHIQKKIASLA
jgi:4-hydroxyphenylpyruvate dioxygenase-like putative hemolysin